MGVPGVISTLSQQGLIRQSRRHSCDHLYIDVAAELHLAVGRRDVTVASVRRTLLSRLRKLVKQYSPSQSLTIAFDGPAPLAKARIQRRRRKGKASGKVSKADLLGLGITPGCQFIQQLHHVGRQVGDEWLQTVPDGEFVLSDSCVPGEAEIKVFSALRTRNARYPGCRHAVVCCDGDAVVMALLLPPTVRLSIDFGACGVLQVADLRAAWATEGMRAAGVPPWPVARPPPLERGGLEGPKRRPRVRDGAEGGWEGFSAEQMDGVLRDIAALILLDKGNDYLLALNLSGCLAGGQLLPIYFAMRAQPRWHRRTLVVLDPSRAAAAFDAEMLLHLLLLVQLAPRSGARFTAARTALTAPAAASAEAEAVGAVLADVCAVGLRQEEECSALQRRGNSSAVWAAWREELPEELQLEALVAAATEPRVAAARDVWAEAVGAAGGGRAAAGEGSGSCAPAAAKGAGPAGDAEAVAREMRAALASMKAAAQPAAAAHLAGLRWCLEMYAFSSCPSFRVMPPPVNVTAASVTAFLSLGWAEHAFAAAAAAPPALAPQHEPGLRAAATLLRCGAPLRYGTLVDRTLTSASPQHGGPADTAEALHAYLNHVEFGGVEPGKPEVLPTLPAVAEDAAAARTNGSSANGGPPAELPAQPPSAGAVGGEDTPQDTPAAMPAGAPKCTSLHPLLLYAPDYTGRQAGEWLRVRSPLGALGPEGCAVDGQWGMWREDDEVGPPLVLPWAAQPLLSVSDAVVHDAARSMYAAALLESRRRLAALLAPGRSNGNGARPPAPKHPLNLLAPHLSYHNLSPHLDGESGGSPAEPHCATPLERMLAVGGTSAADALIEAAFRHSQRAGRSQGADPPSPRASRGGSKGQPGRQAQQLAADELGARLSRQDLAPTLQQRSWGARETAPLSPLGHGLFVLPREAALQVLPKKVAEVLQAPEGNAGGSDGAAGPRVFDAMAPPCSLCDAAANALRRTGVQQRQAQAALTAVAVAAGALRAAARSTAVPLQAWVGAAGGGAAEALWDEDAITAIARATPPPEEHITILALLEKFATPQKNGNGGRKRPPPGSGPPRMALPQQPRSGSAADCEALECLEAAQALHGALRGAWGGLTQVAAADGDQAAGEAHQLLEADVMKAVVRAAKAHNSLKTCAVPKGDEGRGLAAALAAAFSVSAAMYTQATAVQQGRLEAADAAKVVFSAAVTARDLHRQLSHGPHESTSASLERQLNRLPPFSSITSCSLATVRWSASPPAGAAAAAAEPPLRMYEANTRVRGMLAVAAGGVSEAALAEAARGGVVALAPRPVRQGPGAGAEEAHVLDRQAAACLPAFMPRMRAELGRVAARRVPVVSPPGKWPSRRGDPREVNAGRAAAPQCSPSMRAPCGLQASIRRDGVAPAHSGVRRVAVRVRGMRARVAAASACSAHGHTRVGMRSL